MEGYINIYVWHLLYLNPPNAGLPDWEGEGSSSMLMQQGP